MRKRKWHAISFVLCPTLLRLVSMDAELNSVLGNGTYFCPIIGCGTQKSSQTWKSGLKLKKTALWHRKAQDWQMVRPNPLHIMNLRSCSSSIGWVRFWLRPCNLWPRPFFHQKIAKILQKVIAFLIQNWDQIKPWFLHIWIAWWINFFFENTYFFWFCPPSWGKLGPKLDQKCKLWVRPVVVKIWIFKICITW